jgi:hypothetical protein
VRAHVSAREYDDWDHDAKGNSVKGNKIYTAVRVALADPELLAPINLPPPRPRAELPDGGAIKVAGTQGHLQHLLKVLGSRDTGWVYATLEPMVVTGARSRKAVIEVGVNGQTIGVLALRCRPPCFPWCRLSMTPAAVSSPERC